MKDHNESIIIWICIKFLGIFFIYCKLYMFKTWDKSKIFLHVQSTQTSRVESFYFFQMSFFLLNVHHFFWKLERILTLMIRKAKGFEQMNFFYITNLSTFGSNVLLTLKIMDVKNVTLIIFFHIYVIEGMNA